MGSPGSRGWGRFALVDGGVRMDLTGMVAGGVAVVVATAGTDGRPAITRGWGTRYDEVTATLTLCISAPTGSSTLVNLEANGEMAVTVSEPLTYRTVQFKGRADHVGAPSSEDRRRAHEHLDRFAAAVAELGMPTGTEKLFLGDLRLVRFEVVETFQQTPGPDAGSRVV